MKAKGFTATYTLSEEDHKNASIEYSIVIKDYIDGIILKMVVKQLTSKKSIEKRRVQAIVKRAKKKLKERYHDSKRRSTGGKR